MTGHGEMVVKAMSIQFFITMTIILQIVVIIISVKGTLFPGSEIMSEIAGTCAEIIAGLYGITLASYTFFLSRIDALMASDMTLDYIVTDVKMRYKYITWFITINVLMTLFTSMFLMYFPALDGEKLSFFYRLFCNEFIVFFDTSIVMILYYSVSVIEPNCLGKEAKKQKKRLMRPVLPEIRRIHRYYECVVNCTPMTVSQEMCDAAQRVLVFLKEKV